MTQYKTRSKPFLFLSSALISLGALTACETTQSQMTEADRDAKISSVLERAAGNAAATGQTEESLALMERVYKRDSGNQETALKYARSLREAGQLNRAALVLEPVAQDEDNPNAEAKIEYASIQAAIGNYALSEEFSRQAVLLQPESGKAYHLLGIALDAQGYHEQAEAAFRKGLDSWEGDPGPILNNLGLNLASQGFLDEAIDVLRKAKAASPDRVEIERNLRIVSALQVYPSLESSWFDTFVPKPSQKPTLARDGSGA